MKRKIKLSTLRGLTISAVFVLLVASLMFHTGTGTISSFGYESIAAICPLGGLEAMLASRSFILRAAIVFLIICLFTLLVGKAFCSWVCPIPPLSSFFRPEKKRDCTAEADNACGPNESAASGKKITLDSRHIVLGGALLSTAMFGFPVFCLVCPIGLTFATFIGLWRLLQFNEPTWSLVVFPIILVLELVVFRKWCKRICPLGAFLSLVSTWNRFFQPKVDEAKCLRKQGVECGVCTDVCPEGIDPHDAPLAECTKCGRCVDSCPTGAVSLPLIGR